jgi:flagellar hook-associated protein 2
VSAVDGFVKAYNSLMATVKSISGYDAEKKTGSILTGDATVRSITGQLRSVMNRTVTGLAGSYRALADIGIKTQNDGTLVLDQSKLTAALDSSFDEIGRLFAATGTVTDSLVAYEASTSSTREGVYALNVTQTATQGVYADTASSLSSLLVDATNDTFSLKVDGIQSGTISLTQATYGSEAALAAELQSRINGDSALLAAGVSVVVAYDAVNNRFSFTSARYGSGSSVAITSVEDAVASGTIGLTVSETAGTAGVDVAGSLGSLNGTGAGQFLTGAGDASGLKLKVEGTAGARGTVTFSRGIANQLDTLLEQILAADNALDFRTDSLNENIEAITAQRETLNRRLEALEKRYTAQFTAMDVLVAQLNATSNFLTQQLSGLTESS